MIFKILVITYLVVQPSLVLIYDGLWLCSAFLFTGTNHISSGRERGRMCTLS